MPTKENRSVQINLRVTPQFKAALDKAAAADNRPVSNLIEKVMTDYLKKEGFLKK
jgi:hypothetical protein